MNYAPYARIILRYVVGAAFMGSDALGDQLATDPDAVAIASITIGALVEFAYYLAKRFGGKT